jgi:hypothetical protein
MTAIVVLRADDGAVRLATPVAWSVHAHALLPLVEFYPPAPSAAYRPGIVAFAVPETGAPLDRILRPGLDLLTRDLVAIHMDPGEWQQQEGPFAWYRLSISGQVRVVAPARAAEVVRVTKQVAVCRPGRCVLALALFGPTALVGALEPVFAAVRASVQIGT